MLLDVREQKEYASGHIPEAVNVPLSSLDRITLPKDTPLFVYCLRGSRSRQAVAMLCRAGYRDVRCIGGIKGYKGKLA